MSINIAIDGPAGAGKSTIAKEIAKNLLKNDISIEVVSESTGLSIEKLEELKKEA